MRIWDYVKGTDVAHIANAISNMWPDMPNVDVAAHISVLVDIWESDIHPTEGQYIVVHYVPVDDINDEPYWAVSGKYPKGFPENEEWPGYWALDLVPWNIWASMQVVIEEPPPGVKLLSGAEIVALCLNEMTFHGFSQEEIQKKADYLKAVADEALEHPERWMTHEEFLDALANGGFDDEIGDEDDDPILV